MVNLCNKQKVKWNQNFLFLYTMTYSTSTTSNLMWPDFRCFLLAFPAFLWPKRHWRGNLSIIHSGINVDLDTNIVLLQMVSKNALTDQTTDLYIVTCSTPNTMSLARNQTRPDTRQSSRRWLCRSSNVKTTRKSKMWPTDWQTNRLTRQAVESRIRD